MPGKQPPGLQMLPVELQLNIAEYYDYGSLLALRQTNRHFREVADRVECSEFEKASFVRAAEQYPRHANNLGCFRCYRVLPAGEFADKQRKKSHGKGNSKSYLRFCFECGVEKGIYTPGSRVVKDGVDMICCGQCRRVRAVQFCSSCWRCSSCLRSKSCLRLSMSTYQNHTIQGKAPELWYDGLQALGMALRMAEFEANFGEIASPEWFDDDV